MLGVNYNYGLGRLMRLETVVDGWQERRCLAGEVECRAWFDLRFEVDWLQSVAAWAIYSVALPSVNCDWAVLIDVN